VTDGAETADRAVFTDGGASADAGSVVDPAATPSSDGGQ